MSGSLRYWAPIFVLIFIAAPVDASVSISVDGGSGLINATNQSALSITGSIPSFLAGTVNATATDDLGGIVSQSKNLVGLDGGNFTFAIDVSSLVDGTVTVMVEAVESGGAVSTSSPSTLNKQTVAISPEIIFFIVPRTSIASDCTSHPEYFLPYASTTPTNQSVCGVFATSTIATPLNSDGTHFYSANDSFTFTFQDEFGNTGSVVGSVLNIDSTAPIISITSPSSGGIVGQAFTPSITLTDINTATSECRLDTILLSDCTSALSDLSVGTHDFNVDATDSVGNIATSSVSFIVSRSIPALQFVATSTLRVQPLDTNATTTLEIFNVGTSSVAVSVGTLFERADGATLTPGDILFATSTGANFTNITANAVIDGALHFGISGVDVISSASTTMNVYVGASNEGVTLSIFRSMNETTDWTQVGLIDASCVVALGVCSFQTNVLGYFAIVHIVVPPPPSGGGGGGGGGGGPIFLSSPIVATPIISTPIISAPQTSETEPSEGLVLGALTYNFTRTLFVGSKGPDVTALQEFLTQEGLYTGPVTGYFGVLTNSAVKAFQTKIGLESVGIVGPKTRSELNKGSARLPVRSNLNTLQKDAIVALLRAFNADESVIVKVEAVL